MYKVLLHKYQKDMISIDMLDESSITKHKINKEKNILMHKNNNLLNNNNAIM